MARRNPGSSPARRPPSPSPTPTPPVDPAAAWLDLDPDSTARAGERLRRVALGLTASLICARPYWASEFASEADTGRGLVWVAALLATLGVAIAAAFLGGSTRLRFSKADACALALFLLVGLSTSGAPERRMAINLAWEWAGVGIAFFLLRNLPRTVEESSALCGSLAATAVAVAAYGLYQVQVELPEIRELYLRHPDRVLGPLGIDPASTSRLLFENRLLRSNEPWSTFALANSLAGFLVGPAALGLAVLLHTTLRRDDKRRDLRPLLALLPGSVLLYCLILTKSRSAYLGLLAALVVLAWRERRRVSARALGLGLVGVAALVFLLAGLAWLGGGLDKEVLTQSTLSLRYRWEYWQGAAGVIGERPWTGRGPGNFAGPYLRHMRPTASEQITDPHQMLLEVWATAGLPALIALVGALAFGLRDLLGPGRPIESAPPTAAPPEAAPPRSAAWLVGCAGLSWLLVVALGRLDPITQGDLLVRWLVLGGAWLLAALLGMPLWRRGPVGASAAGVGVLAIAVNLLAAGGIGMSAVALGLWSLLALGLNLRDDRPCGRRRVVGGRTAAFVLGAIWAALVGIYIAALSPFWESQAHLDRASELAYGRQSATIDEVEAEFRLATQADAYSAEPWLRWAEYRVRLWNRDGMKDTATAWNRVKYLLDQAARPPRAPNAPAMARQRARIVDELLRAPELPEPFAKAMKDERVNALARAVRLDPTPPALHAELADALAASGRLDLARREAREALRLDALTPHLDRKLPDDVRRRMQAGFPPEQAADPPS